MVRPAGARRLYEYGALVAGGSLQAAAGLCSGRCRVAVNLDGGRHHAAKSKAAGFCYTNDVVGAGRVVLAWVCGWAAGCKAAR